MRPTKKNFIINASKKKSFREALKRNKVTKISLFGSVARNEARLKSDVDFLAEFTSNADLFDVIGLKQDLQALLKRKVDVVTPKALSQNLKIRISKDLVDL